MCGFVRNPQNANKNPRALHTQQLGENVSLTNSRAGEGTERELAAAS